MDEIKIKKRKSKAHLASGFNHAKTTLRKWLIIKGPIKRETNRKNLPRGWTRDPTKKKKIKISNDNRIGNLIFLKENRRISVVNKSKGRNLEIYIYIYIPASKAKETHYVPFCISIPSYRIQAKTLKKEGNIYPRITTLWYFYIIYNTI